MRGIYFVPSWNLAFSPEPVHACLYYWNKAAVVCSPTNQPANKPNEPFIVMKLVIISPYFMVWRLINVITKACYLHLSRASFSSSLRIPVWSSVSHFIYFSVFQVLFYFSVSPTKIFYEALISNIRATCPPISSFLIYSQWVVCYWR